jgi:thymidylate synthase
VSQSLLAQRGGFYDVYLETVYPRLRRATRDWGRYFERMIRHQTADGRVINPLADLVAKLRAHVQGKGRTFRNIYELTISDRALDISIYDPERDAAPVMNRQCLSFLSFKLDPQNRLMLTALYRNHYYIQRLLGNLVGLGKLMAFVGRDAGVEVGSLTIISTHAEVEAQKWRRSEVEDLLRACEQVPQQMTVPNQNAEPASLQSPR